MLMSFRAVQSNDKLITNRSAEFLQKIWFSDLCANRQAKWIIELLQFLKIFDLIKHCDKLLIIFQDP